MGVRHLQTYITRDVDRGVKTIDIAEEIEGYKRYHNIEKPLIVIDLYTLPEVRRFNIKEIALGGLYGQFNECLDLFLKKLVYHGVSLVFFSDGTIQTSKLKTCLQRQSEKYERSSRFFDIIDSNFDELKLKECQIDQLTPVLKNLPTIASKYGPIYRTQLNECDLELAAYAYKNKAFAIIGNDSDFLIFEGNWRLWSSRINLNNFTTIQYNRLALRRNLSLTCNQMTLLATLCGNDILRYEEVEHFLKPMGYGVNKFQDVAQIIRNLHTEPPNLSLRDANYLSKLIFPPQEVELGVEKIFNSLNSYNYATIKQHGNSFIDKIAKDSSNLNYEILQSCPSIINLLLFDLRHNIHANCLDFIITARRKVMGILLQHLNDKNVTRILHYKKNHETPFEPFEIKPEFPNIKVPPLPELLLTPYGNNSELDKLRLELLCWQISPRLLPEVIGKIPEDYLIDVLTIFFLYENQQITLQEADCLMLANCDKQFDFDSLKLDNIKKINSRDSRIAYIFPVMYINICGRFYAVGLSKIKSLIKFNGLYFHFLREKWDKLNINDQEKSLKSVQHLRIYSKE